MGISFDWKEITAQKVRGADKRPKYSLSLTVRVCVAVLRVYEAGELWGERVAVREPLHWVEQVCDEADSGEADGRLVTAAALAQTVHNTEEINAK